MNKTNVFIIFIFCYSKIHFKLLFNLKRDKNSYTNKREKMKKNITPKFMRANQLAKYLGLGLSTVWLYAKQGKITPKKISAKVTLFDVVEVEKALLGA